MNPRGRVLLPGATGNSPAANLAMEEALFLKNEGFILRLWEDSESVVIGRAQLAEFETDLAFCVAEGIPVVRRFTAGGAVYHGPGNINWSLFVSRNLDSGRLRFEQSPRSIFGMSFPPIVAALKDAGVRAWLSPPNSLVTTEGKVSGMAAYVSRGGFLCHGTLLVGADLARVKRLTTPAGKALQRRYTRSKDVTTANTGVDVDSFIRSLVRTVADETRLTMEEGTVEGGERELANELLSTKYGTESWNLGDPFSWSGKTETLAVR